MPENDFSNSQITQPSHGKSETRDTAIVAIALLGVGALLLLGMLVEQLAIFLCLIAAGIALAIIYSRAPKIQAVVTRAFQNKRTFATVLIVLLLASYPVLLRNNPYLIHIGALAAIYAIMALGLNITLGYAGLLDIGFAVYFGAGAYTSAQIAIHFGISFWLSSLLGGLCASFFGFLIAWPALRVQDHYLGLVTLGYGLMMNLLARNVYFLTNGTDGVINIPPPAIGSYQFTKSLDLGFLQLPFQANYYYLAVAFALLAAFISYRLQQSKLGRSWDAIREDEIAAKCSGVDTRGLKILAFSMGAFFGGIGGAIYAHMIGFVSPENFTFLESINILVMVVIGGAGNILGVVFGAVFFVVLPERFREFEHFRLLFFGLALTVLMINRPEGIFPRLRKRRMLSAEKVKQLLARTSKKSHRTSAP
jgi:branched-chain amino acid transport system permease protein